MTRNEMLQATRGIALAPITPFKLNGSIDDDGIRHLVDFIIKKGLNKENGFLMPLSTTGNFLSLSMEEKKEVIITFMEACSGRLQIVVGCNNVCLADTIELAKFSQDCGAIAIIVGPPFYWKPNEPQIVNHYHQICSSVDIGIIIYNNHWASQVDISVDILEKLSENPNIIGLKESTYSIEKLIQVAQRFSTRINILNGLGEAYEPLYTKLGCAGFSSTLGNIIPELSVKLYSYLIDHKFEEAHKLANQLAPLTHFMDSLTGGQYISALTHILNHFGICENGVRPPIIPLTPVEIQKLEKLMKDLKSTGLIHH